MFDTSEGYAPGPAHGPVGVSYPAQELPMGITSHVPPIKLDNFNRFFGLWWAANTPDYIRGRLSDLEQAEAAIERTRVMSRQALWDAADNSFCDRTWFDRDVWWELWAQYGTRLVEPGLPSLVQWAAWWLRHGVLEGDRISHAELADIGDGV